MFRVKLNDNRVIAFTFQHVFFDEPKEIKPKVWVKAQTRCSLENGFGTTIYDWAYCSAKDVFDKEKGRKVALAKCMTAAGLDKTEREMVWERYFYRDVSNSLWNGEGVDEAV